MTKSARFLLLLLLAVCGAPVFLIAPALFEQDCLNKEIVLLDVYFLKKKVAHYDDTQELNVFWQSFQRTDQPLASLYGNCDRISVQFADNTTMDFFFVEDGNSRVGIVDLGTRTERLIAVKESAVMKRIRLAMDARYGAPSQGNGQPKRPNQNRKENQNRRRNGMSTDW